MYTYNAAESVVKLWYECIASVTLHRKGVNERAQRSISVVILRSYVLCPLHTWLGVVNAVQ